jgi:hypothetical protein
MLRYLSCLNKVIIDIKYFVYVKIVLILKTLISCRTMQTIVLREQFKFKFEDHTQLYVVTSNLEYHLKICTTGSENKLDSIHFLKGLLVRGAIVPDLIVQYLYRRPQRKGIISPTNIYSVHVLRQVGV